MEAGFESPRTAKDNYTLGLWRKHGLGDHPSCRNIEPVAIRLLGNHETAMEGISIVMGRRVDSRETEIVAVMLLSPTDAFGLLLLQSSVEQLNQPLE